AVRKGHGRGGSIQVRGTDDTAIRGAAGANALAIAGGGGNVSLSGAIGFSVAVNTVSNGTHAFIDGATVTAAGDVSVESSSSTQIDAITVAGTEAGTASGSVGLSFEGVGAGSINTVSNTTQAPVRCPAPPTPAGPPPLPPTPPPPPQPTT